MYLLGRFLRCLVALGSTGSILKSISRCFYRGAVSRVFKIGVGSILAQQRLLLEGRLE